MREPAREMRPETDTFTTKGQIVIPARIRRLFEIKEVNHRNYEAREFGVRSAMPGFMARDRCPHIIFLPCRFDLYREASSQIRATFHEYTPLVEPLFLDAAYLDVTASGRFSWTIAKETRAKIHKETRLTASAGIVEINQNRERLA